VTYKEAEKLIQHWHIGDADWEELENFLFEQEQENEQFRTALRTIANGKGWAAGVAQKSLDIAAGKFK